MNEPKTPNLGLNKIDRSSPSTTYFDLDKYLDQNWEKVDEGVATKQDLEELREAVGEIDVPDASLTQKGKVQLSNKVDGISETMAATERAVSDARKAAETSAKNASLSRNGGTLTGSGGILSIVNETPELDGLYAQLYPEGIEAGRKAWFGFGDKYSRSLTLTNEFLDGDIVFRDRTGTTSIADLKQSGVKAKQRIVDSLNVLGESASTSDDWEQLEHKLRVGKIYGPNKKVPIEKVKDMQITLAATFSNTQPDIKYGVDIEGNITFGSIISGTNLYKLTNINPAGVERWTTSMNNGWTLSALTVNSIRLEIATIFSRSVNNVTESQVYIFDCRNGVQLRSFQIEPLGYSSLELDDDGLVYVKESYRVNVYDASGGIRTTISYYYSGKEAVCVDRKNGEIYLHANFNGKTGIHKFSNNGTYLWYCPVTFFGGFAIGMQNGVTMLHVRTTGSSNVTLINAKTGEKNLQITNVLPRSFNPRSIIMYSDSILADDNGMGILYGAEEESSGSNYCKLALGIYSEGGKYKRSLDFSDSLYAFINVKGIFASGDGSRPDKILFIFSSRINVYNINAEILG